MTTELADPPFTPLTRQPPSGSRRSSRRSPGIVTAVVRSTYAPDEARLVWVSGRIASSTPDDRRARYPSLRGGTHLVARRRSRGRARRGGRALQRRLRPSRRDGPDDGRTTSARQRSRPERFALFHRSPARIAALPVRRVRAVDSPALRRGIRLDGRRAGVRAEPARLHERLVRRTRRRSAWRRATGSACGATLEEAILAGLVRAHRARRSHARMEEPALAPAARLVARRGDRGDRPARVRSDAASATACSTAAPSSTYPSQSAVVHGPPGEQTALAIGGGAGATVSVAWLKALAEAFGVRRWLALKTLEDPDGPVARAGRRSKTFDDHMLFYAAPREGGARGLPRRIARVERPRRPCRPSRAPRRGPRSPRCSAGWRARSARPTSSTSRHPTWRASGSTLFASSYRSSARSTSSTPPGSSAARRLYRRRVRGRARRSRRCDSTT